MRGLLGKVGVGLLVIASLLSATTVLVPAPAQAKACSQSGGFFGFPHWYDGLEKHTQDVEATGGQTCAIIINKPEDAYTIVLNIIDIVLRLVGVIAVIFIIIGGIRYVVSQGDPGALSTAKQSITRAIIGLVIALSAVLILNFVIGVFGLRTAGDKNTITSMRAGDA